MSKHPIVYVEIPADDLKAASQFYAQAFGWQVDSSMEEYPMFHAEGGPGGGFVKVGEQGGLRYKIGEPLLYLDTDDIDASLAAVEAHGGKTLVPKTKISDEIGWYACFADPAGNRLGLFQRPRS